MNWYEVKNADKIDSPALLIYPERVAHNIRAMIDTVQGDVTRLVPHVKTHKMPEIIRLQLQSGIQRFKCATIAELEMVLEAGAKFVLMAYPLVGPKINRFLFLKKKFPLATIASLVDGVESAERLSKEFLPETAIVYLDINNGQNRTGHQLDGDVLTTYLEISKIKNIRLAGLHVYDGHIRDSTVAERRNHSNQNFQPVYELIDQIEKEGLKKPEVITCGSPSFSSAALREGVYCSPGTTILWDWNYSALVPEVNVQWAAVLLTRVISKPAPGIITTDLGHKSVGAENPIDKRVHFINLTDYQATGQNEEHLILKVKDWEAIHIGDILYGIPYHVCPSVALYDEAHVIRANEWTEIWEVAARRKKITI